MLCSWHPVFLLFFLLVAHLARLPILRHLAVKLYTFYFKFRYTYCCGQLKYEGRVQSYLSYVSQRDTVLSVLACCHTLLPILNGFPACLYSAGEL